MNVAAASAILQGGDLKFRSPKADLHAYLGCFWSLTTTAETHLRGLPDGCCMLWFERQLFLSGPLLVPTERIPDPGQLLFGVRLQPGVGFLLTGLPVHSLAGKHVRLTQFLRHHECVSRLENQLAAATADDERFDLLETLLQARLAGKRLDPRVAEAMRRIEDSGGQIRMAQLAGQCQTSARHLSRLLRCWVGLTPKRLARVMRFQAMLQHLQLPNPASTAHLAAKLGYFDQSHLSGEAGRLSGIAPGMLSKRHMADFSKTRCR